MRSMQLLIVARTAVIRPAHGSRSWPDHLTARTTYGFPPRRYEGRDVPIGLSNARRGIPHELLPDRAIRQEQDQPLPHRGALIMLIRHSGVEPLTPRRTGLQLARADGSHP